MTAKPVFPTAIHRETAEIVRHYFSNNSGTDTVLVVNSCARGQAVPESDLDFAILTKPGTTQAAIDDMEAAWRAYASAHPVVIHYKQSSPFAHLHLDVISGNYMPGVIEIGEPCDYFEIEIGNQICYSAPMGEAGPYFKQLQEKWLPYYDEELRLERLKMVTAACNYDLDHIPLFVKRGLHFQAFDILCKAFREYLQALFIANKTYPIAYNKWIKEQVAKWLGKPDLYPKLPPLLSVCNLESGEINDKAMMLRDLLKSI